ncbi:MFS transporter [Aquihabitans daechungensis]|uniref:MFS transporter n=1 Tax=Aquihabitans daechungensis TaxID=1052257 RepID=UPI003BA36788
MTPRTTVNELDVDQDGLHALVQPRDDVLLEDLKSADPSGHDFHFTCAEGPFVAYDRTLHADRLDGGGYHVREEIVWDIAIPLWGALFRPLVARQLRRTEPPEVLDEDQAARQAPWWSPPARLDARSSSILSMLCGLSMLTGYLGTTITQTMTYAAKEFGASTAQQGATLAAVRIGVLLSLVLVTLSDRQGRKKLLLVCAIGGVAASVAGAASPGLVALGGTQTVARAFATALAVLIGVVSVEEMPAGGRAYAASVLAMTAALGAGMAVILLPVADLGIATWRIVYIVPLFGLPFFVRLARKVPESRRFVRPHGRATMRGHRGRLALLATAGFFGLLFLAPVSQFQNEFLRSEHGFTAIQLTIFTLATNTPGGIGIVVGGRLADLRGRRTVGAVASIVGAILLAVGYQVSGAALWLAWMAGTVIAAATVPALGVYGAELFPTSLRGRANGLITLAGVCGSSVGLILAGRFETHFGSFGPGMAILAIGPFIVAALVLTLYPETAHVELEVLNPEDALEAGAVAITPPML